MAGLPDLALRHPCLRAMRGRGLAMGVQSSTAETSPATDAAATDALMFRAQDLGIGVCCSDPSSNVPDLAPPLIIADRDIEQALFLVAEVIRDLEAARIDDTASAGFAGW